MKKNLLLVFIAVVLAFTAGGFAFTVLWPPVNDGAEERVDGEIHNVFQSPPEEIVALPAPVERVRSNTPEDDREFYKDNMPSQLNKIQGIRGIVPKSEQTPKPDTEDSWVEVNKGPVSIDRNLTGREKGGFVDEELTALSNADSRISMIDAPVKALIIQSQADYRKFKARAKGTYPQVDFSKNMIIALESDSNLPDKVFEIRSAQEKDGKLVVEYVVNVFGLDKKINTHTIRVVKSTGIPIDLVQVL